MSAKQMFMLMYDVPQGAEVEHPSIWLRGLAIRLQLSVWLIHEDDIPHGRFTEMNRTAGVTWDIIPFDPNANRQLLTMAARSLKNDIAEAVRSARQSAERAILRASRSHKSAVLTARKYRADVKRIAKNLGVTLALYREAASKFGFEGDRMGLPQAIQTFAALKSATMQKSQTLMRAAAELEKKERNSPMARAVRQGGVPADVFADYAEEKGVDVTHVRDVFA